MPEPNVVTVNDLRFSYPDGHVALRGISLNLCAGDKVALVGPNGAGKSTLMLHMNGILNGHGVIEVGGMRLTRDNLPVIRAMVGLVFQNPDDQLFSPTVFEDVAFGPLHMGLPEADVITRVDSALEAVRMSAYRDRLSHHLSVGEKKRIASYARLRGRSCGRGSPRSSGWTPAGSPSRSCPGTSRSGSWRWSCSGASTPT